MHARTRAPAAHKKTSDACEVARVGGRHGIDQPLFVGPLSGAVPFATFQYITRQDRVNLAPLARQGGTKQCKHRTQQYLTGLARRVFCRAANFISAAARALHEQIGKWKWDQGLSLCKEYVLIT